MKQVVISGNNAQALEWIKNDVMKRIKNQDTSASMSYYIILNDPQKLRGIRDPHGVFIGTWRQRKDIIEVMELLMIATITPNRTIADIWQEVKTNGIVQP